jgi:hypothetical protein
MGLDDFVAFLEAYLRDYVRYLLRLFSAQEAERQARELALAEKAAAAAQGAAAAAPVHHSLSSIRFSEEITDTDGKLLTYALISVTLGTLLQRTFISGEQFANIDFPHAITIEVCFWFAVSIVAHLFLNIGRHTSDFSDSLSAVLRILPPAFVAAAYSSFVIYNIDFAWQSFENEPFADYYARWDASVVNAIIQWLLIAGYLPWSLRAHAHPRTWRIWAATVAATLLVGVVDAAVVFNLTSPVENAASAGQKPDAAKS